MSDQLDHDHQTPSDLPEPDPSGAYFVNVPTTARQLGLSRAAIYRLIRRNQVRTVKYGTRRLIPASAVAELAQRIADGTVEPITTPGPQPPTPLTSTTGPRDDARRQRLEQFRVSHAAAAQHRQASTNQIRTAPIAASADRRAAANRIRTNGTPTKITAAPPPGRRTTAPRTSGTQ